MKWPKQSSASMRIHLEDRYGDLAYHYRLTSNGSKAFEYLKLAGLQAEHRSAYAEAVPSLTAAAELLRKLPETRARELEEFELQMTLAHLLRWTTGYTAPAVENAWLRAVELSQRIGDSSRIVRAQMGLAQIATMGGDRCAC
jgi:predicted ATPase